MSRKRSPSSERKKQEPQTEQGALHKLYGRMERIRSTKYRYNIRVQLVFLEGMPATKAYEYVVVVARKSSDMYESPSFTVDPSGTVDLKSVLGEKGAFRFLISYYYVDGKPQRKDITFTLRQVPRLKSAITAGEKPAEVGTARLNLAELRKEYKPYLKCPNTQGSKVRFTIELDYQCMEMGEVGDDAKSRITDHVGSADEKEKKKEEESRKSSTPGPGRSQTPLIKSTPPDDTELESARKRYQELLSQFRQIPPQRRNEKKVGEKMDKCQGVMLKVDSQDILEEYVAIMDDIEAILLMSNQESLEKDMMAQRRKSVATPQPTKSGMPEGVEMQERAQTPAPGGAKKKQQGGAAPKPKSRAQEVEELREQLRWIKYNEEYGGSRTCEGCVVM